MSFKADGPTSGLGAVMAGVQQRTITKSKPEIAGMLLIVFGCLLTVRFCTGGPAGIRSDTDSS